MLQPSGAMALFVLRLAGLLSLEKALKENASLELNGVEGPLGNLSHYYFDYEDRREKQNGSDIFGNFSYAGFNISSTLHPWPNQSKPFSEYLDVDPESTKEDPYTIDLSESISSTTEPYSQPTSYTNSTKILESSSKSPREEESTFPWYDDQSDLKIPGEIENGTSKYGKNSTLYGEENASTLPPRDQNTGFSKVFTEEYEKEMSKKVYFPNPFTTTSSIYEDSLNASFEEDSYLSFEASPDNFVSPFSLSYDESQENSSIITLNSRSLVVPVAKNEYNEAAFSNITSESKESEGNEDSKIAMVYNDTTVSPVKGKPHETRGVGPIRSGRRKMVINTSRNNPYPYGPKILPDSHLPYNPDLEPKEIPEPFGNIIPDENIFYDYSYEEEDYDQLNKERQEERMKLLAKTEEPRILFHFDKPGGYSPKLPDSSLPPTRSPTPSDPWDCKPRCPGYKLLDWNPDYDIRQYPETTWISTVIIAKNRILAELEGYMKVQDYFYGLNDRGQLMNLTIPFVTQVKYGRHPGVLEETKDFVVSLYINHEDDPYGYDLPTPISNEVLIDHLETKTVFVSGFEANVWEVTEESLKERVTQVMNKLRQNGEAFLDRYFYLASYNRPELYQPVYYEVWIYATTFRETTQAGVSFAPRRSLPESKITSETIDRLCRGVECPPFEVLRTYKYGIQKRRYYNALFVTTTPDECQFSTISVWKGFMPLHLYKHGINSHMEVIEATRPIALVHVKEDFSPETECPQNMTMAIYLPKRFHSNPPLTGFAAPNVAINALQDVVVFAYTVGGYLLEPNRVRKELADMKYRLTEFGACFKDDEYYVVVYDFIVRYHGRQNELWIVAENCKATRNG